ncbi:MAG TPA: prepilin peptidase [Pseudonocardiaceae bacterium]|nr:prepilin peptidase [Pseudonocardiaceae bacterium]
MVELICLVGLLGLLIGSFLNVVIHRVPRGESLVSPPSRCPKCGADIKARHNVPVVGWLVLRGRCAECRAPISVRYPLVELGTGLVFAGLAAQLGHQLWALPAYLYFAAIGIALALIDIDVRRLPNAVVLPSYPVLAVLLALAAFLEHDWWALLRAVIGAAALFAFYFVLAMAYPAGMGFGDVRLAGLIGAVLAYQSWSALIIGAFGGFVLGAIVGVAVIASQKGDRKTALPFGPFMIAAALAAIFVATPIADAYRSLLGT